MSKALPAPIEERIKVAAQCVEGYRTADQIREELITLGVESVDDLVEDICNRGDLLHVVGYDDTDKRTPKVKAHKAVAALYGTKTTTGDARQDELKELGIKTGIKTIPTARLLTKYLPGLADDPITIELKARLGDRKVILFKPGTTEVDIEATIAYYSDLERGYPERSEVPTSAGLARPRSVGETPDQMTEEDPLYPDQPLRNGRSLTEPFIDWSKVSVDVRKLCRVIVDEGKVDVDSNTEVIGLAKLADKGLDALKEVYPTAFLRYTELAEADELPTLKIRLRETKRKNDPFNVNKRTY